MSGPIPLPMSDPLASSGATDSPPQALTLDAAVAQIQALTLQLGQAMELERQLRQKIADQEIELKALRGYGTGA